MGGHERGHIAGHVRQGDRRLVRDLERLIDERTRALDLGHETLEVGPRRLLYRDETDPEPPQVGRAAIVGSLGLGDVDLAPARKRNRNREARPDPDLTVRMDE